MTLRELFCRLTGLPRQLRPDRDFDDEIASHLELAKADYQRQGKSEAEAERLAGKRFGSIAAAKENVWEQRHAPGMSAVLQDVRYAARGMRKSPGFTLTTIGTLALGIGLCSFMYSMLRTMFRPLAGVPDPGQLAMLQTPVPYPWFESYRERGKSAWDATSFIAPVPLTIAFGAASPDRVDGALVSPDYFSTLRVQPMLGRFFDPQREHLGASPTLVITERFWRMRLNSDPHVIGRTLRINGRAVPIVGVGLPDFSGVSAAFAGFPEIFIAATADPKIAPELKDNVLHRTVQPAFGVLLRLHPGVSLAQAEARLDAETHALSGQREKKGRLVRLMPAGTLLPLPQEARALLLIFYGVLICVILGLTCANLGALVLARGAARGREFAIRLSIGADRLRLIRQLLTESAISSAGGGIGGFLAAYAILDLVRSTRTNTVSDPIGDALASGPDLHVALFGFALSAIAAAGFGLLPALAITRLDLMHAMKANLNAGLDRYRRLGLRNLFVVSQVAAAMMLVLMMGFFIVGVQYGPKTEPGFDPGPVSFFSIDPQRDGLNASESADVLRRLPQQLARVSGVEGVSLADRPPLDNTYPDTPVSAPSGKTQNVVIQNVRPGFFTTLGATILRGADFRDRDLPPGSGKLLPVVINQTAATELFGNGDALGGRIQQSDKTWQVAAVVRYAPRSMLMGRPIPIVFVPLTAQDLERPAPRETIVVLRSRTPIGIAALNRGLAAVDERLTLFHFRTMQEHLAESDRLGSRATALYGPIGLFGLILACLGLAGVTAQTVQRRSAEIGIRMALGAQKSQVLRLVMGEGAAMVAIGATLGYGAASALVRVLSAMAAPVADQILPVAKNPAVAVGIPAFLIALAAIACYLPARRSASIDPVLTLREE